MTGRTRNRTATAACLIAMIAACAAPAAAETYDLYIHSFCSPGSNCGAASEDAYRVNLHAMTQHLNNQWAPHGITFRPVIFPIQSSDPMAYSITGCDVDAPGNPLACSSSGTSCAADSDCPGDETCEPQKFCDDFTTVCSEDADCAGIGNEQCWTWNQQQRYRLRDMLAVNQRNAISLLLFENAGTCCANPPSPDDSDATISVIFCDAARAARAGGSVWSHEMGHYWCLRHTFTGADWLDGGTEPDHDGDDPFGVHDTPADPRTTETEDIDPRCDTDTSIRCSRDTDCPSNGMCRRDVYLDGRDYCVRTVAGPSTDPQSTYPSYCEAECRRCQGGTCNADFGFPGTEIDTGYEPFLHNAMSYYGPNCRAPFSVNGEFFWPFTQDQIEQIEICRTAWPRRAELPDVCATSGGDSDGDGICQDDDNCPDVENVDQRDLDGDGEGDPCDLCPTDPTPTGDIDGDGLGDACDIDRDNDGCNNRTDQHPDEAMQASGTTFLEGPCESEQYTTYTFEGEDSDSDGVLDCEDIDDDNDTICDGPESSVPGSPGAPSDGCAPGPDPCPTVPGTGCIDFAGGNDCIDPWLECIGGGCNEYYAVWERVVNPDPTSTLVLDRIRIHNQTLYAAAPRFMTPASTALHLSGQAVTGFGTEDAYRIELWRVGDFQPIGVLIPDFTPSEVDLGEIHRGGWVAIEENLEDLGNRLVSIRTTYGWGFVTDNNDDDDVPSFADNCMLVHNPDQLDNDGDGFGNRCDADVDNDGDSDADDYALVNSCDGVVVALEVPLSEPDDYDLYGAVEPGLEVEIPDQALIDEALRCAVYDLTGDGLVDYRDRNILEGWSGPAGPSGLVDRLPWIDAGPDRTIDCGQTFSISGSESNDPDGEPVTCAWSSPTCSVADPGDCDTTATCPPGGIHTILLTVSDGTHEVTDPIQVDSTSCSPGSAGDTLRVSKTPDGIAYLSWSASCAQPGLSFAVYEGDLHAPGAASLQPHDCTTAPGYIVTQSFHDDAYYLVAPRADTYIGSLGTDSDGVYRAQPGGAAACASIQAVAECPTGAGN